MLHPEGLKNLPKILSKNVIINLNYTGEYGKTSLIECVHINNALMGKFNFLIM